jgi:hypothetical protein
MRLRVYRWIFLRLLRRLARESEGQAMVESAIVIPLMVFIILGVIQLVMMQHAKIMTEYAAFNAARAGIVWNGDRIIMENAAIISLLPTYEGLLDESGMTDPLRMLRAIGQRALLYQVNRRIPQAVDLIQRGARDIIGQIPVGQQGQGAMTSGVNDLLNAAGNMANDALRQQIGQALGVSSDDSLVTVEILNPTGAFSGGSSGEIDFDTVEAANRATNRLTIRVRYYYMMRVPFANWLISQAWLTAESGRQLYGAVWNPQTVAGETGFRDTGEVPPPTSGDRTLRTVQALATQGVYVVPLWATYTMRMQSNLYRTSLQLQ